MSDPVGYVVVLADNLTQTRNCTFQFNFAVGASADEMGKELDKLTAVLDRQHARAGIEGREQFLKAQRTILAGIQDDIARGERKLTTMEPDPIRRNKDQATKTLADALEKQKMVLADVQTKIDATEKELEDLRKKAA